jgi:hypothetical protein
MLGAGLSFVVLAGLTWSRETHWWHVGVAAFGVLMFAATFGVKITYHVSIRRGGREARVLSSHDPGPMAQIVSAIQEAMQTSH